MVYDAEALGLIACEISGSVVIGAVVTHRRSLALHHLPYNIIIKRHRSKKKCKTLKKLGVPKFLYVSMEDI